MSIEPLAGGDSVRPESFQPTSRTRRRSRKLALSYTGILGSLVLAAIVASALYLLFAKSVRIEIGPGDAAANVAVRGKLVFASGPSWLVLPGTYEVSAIAPGFHELSTSIEVGDPRIQTFRLEMAPLPGRIQFQSDPAGASVLNSELAVIAETPGEALLESGQHVLLFRKDRYQGREVELDVSGRNRVQTVSATLTPNWAVVQLATRPEGAQVLIDKVDSGFTTAGPIEVLAGEHIITVRAAGYREWSDIIEVEPLQELELPEVVLERASGQARVTTVPEGAAVVLDGEFVGNSPLEVELYGKPVHSIELVLTGYQNAIRSIPAGQSTSKRIHVDLQPVTGTLEIRTDPADALITIDGIPQASGLERAELQAGLHQIEVSREGYASYVRELRVQPNLVFELHVRLLTHEEARLEALKRIRTAVNGKEIVLLQPSPIRMGASRSQPGRRANEVYRTAKLSRFFYLSRHEVTNAEYRELVPKHDSGSFSNQTLDKPDQPVVNVEWIDAAKYCNYLSGNEGVKPFYEIQNDTVTRINPDSLGYRLPAEAEWTWAARHDGVGYGLRVFSWGEGLPPPSRFENFADSSAQHAIGRTLFGYNDNFLVSAPVGKFAPNQNGIYDIGGNVSEWVTDYYEVPDVDTEVGPLGPATGEYRVIRGASWMHGTITELRLSFRDYGLEGRRDVGFRIARFAE